jgi:mono/diheme cytochrome c family protein
MRFAHAPLIAAAALALSGSIAFAQAPTYGVGRPPTPDEVKAWDTWISPSGRELPKGRGTAEEGKAVYTAQCARCHGATGREGPNEVLVGGAGTLKTAKPLKTVGSYWPYATTLWDYLNRAMPFDRPGTLTTNDVYAAAAYVLHLNGIIAAADVLDEQTLPRIKMPNRDGFVPDTRPDTGSRPVTPPKRSPGSPNAQR